ncbi:MAG: metal-sulfur cluster assembly factor [Puniceicoccales bacterium]|jgi:metal-sulfur cluster biosynthetic enzyme|nr:metal-sulfur cluster assembly factor [Puniceicoccales bacterium]
MDSLASSPPEPLPCDADCFWEQLKTVLDPDVNVNVVDLGLIYGISVEPCSAEGEHSHRVSVQMTLTSPTCPLGDYLLTEVKQCIENHPAVKEVQVELVWEPPWHKDMITEAGRMELGWL